MQQTTTIAAISTPAGAGGIGIVRLSGPDSAGIAEKLFRPHGNARIPEMKGYTGTLGRVFDARGDLDDAILFRYRAPKSYTGEEVVELSCHGGSYLLRRVLELCVGHGAVPAGPGEFTKRAFLNGKLDLAQAESVMDLIAAQGDAAARAALSARDGALSTGLEEIVETLLAGSAHLAAWTDYPDEDLEELDSAALLSSFQSALSRMETLLSTWDRGKLLREGVRTAIVGKPNVGKSSLMNLLAGEQRSIVTEIPGTTRDLVEELVRLGDWVLRLTDTAGIRDTADPVERIGVDRARAAMEGADLILAVFDSAAPLGEEDRQLLDLLEGRRCVAVFNKADLPPQAEREAIAGRIPRAVTLSAATGQGRGELEEEVARLLELDRQDPAAAIVANQRQRECLLRAKESLSQAVESLVAGWTLDAVNVLVDDTLDALLSLTGKRATQEVVDQVFARFCVGK